MIHVKHRAALRGGLIHVKHRYLKPLTARLRATI